MIYFIYTKEQENEAEDILYFLVKEKDLPVISRNGTCYILESDERICEDSAVILVSDVAVLDEGWQTMVRQIPENVRFIPVGGTENADYSNPEVVPPRIEEVNFIRMDENCCDNIWDSLIIEKDFYHIKNTLLSNMQAWIFSKGSETFLLSEIKEIEKYLLILRKKWEKEKNIYIAEELTEIIKYLNLSLKYAKQLKRKRIIDNIKRISIIAVAIVAAAVFYWRAEIAKQMRQSQVYLSTDVQPSVVPVSVVKMMDGMMNLPFSETAKLGMYNKLSEYLNLNWSNGPFPINYKWALNDAQAAVDEQYVWAAGGNGDITKWDTYTGEIVEQENVSSQPLNLIGVSNGEKLFGAVDSEGYIFKKHAGELWEKSKESYDIPFVQGNHLLCNEDHDFIIVTGDNGKLFCFDVALEIRLIWEKQYDKIFCAEYSEQGVEVVIEKQGKLYDLYIGMDQKVRETLIPIFYESTCTMGILNGTVLMADENFQIVTWNKENPEIVNPSGLVLSRPMHLCFLNEDVIVWNDRNEGTHLYDLERKLDLGSVLNEMGVVARLSASQNTVLAFRGDGIYQTENVEALLPINELTDNDVCAVYTEQEASSNGKLRNASIENEYMIRVELQSGKGDMTLMLDGGSRYYIGEAQRDFSLVEAGDTEIFYHNSKPVNFTGKPVVIGITGNGEALLVGGSDGSFFEIVFTEDGNFVRGSQRQIPSHAAVAAIYQTEDAYYIKDVTGTFWKARIGYEAVTEEGAIKAVKEKLHYTMTTTLFEIVSEDTIKKLELKCEPGQGKEWE